jgi:hypothetical protein
MKILTFSCALFRHCRTHPPWHPRFMLPEPHSPHRTHVCHLPRTFDTPHDRHCTLRTIHIALSARSGLSIRSALCSLHGDHTLRTYVTALPARYVLSSYPSRYRFPTPLYTLTPPLHPRITLPEPLSPHRTHVFQLPRTFSTTFHAIGTGLSTRSALDSPHVRHFVFRHIQNCVPRTFALSGRSPDGHYTRSPLRSRHGHYTLGTVPRTSSAHSRRRMGVRYKTIYNLECHV